VALSGTVERIAVRVPGGSVALALHTPEGAGRFPGVVACHGLSASKDSDKYLLLAQALPAAGIALARFDFRGCGESSGVEIETTIASRIEDVEAVIGALASHPRLGRRLGLLGSSLGGFVAIHVAARRGDEPPVVTWNTPADLRDLPPPEEPCGLGPAFHEELRAGRHATAPAGVRRHLVVQAERDDVVPPAHAVRLHARAAAPARIVTIAGADHRFSDARHRGNALAASLDWFREQF
jgi:uncharacterized protein